MTCGDDDSISASSNEISTSGAPSASSPSSRTSTKRKAGRKKFRETRHPFYRGVRERSRGGGGGGGKWVCEVREPNKRSRIWLGTFPNPEMAARAHDVAAIALRGDAAPLNFPDSAWTLPRARSASHDHIRCAATEAVKMHCPVAWTVLPGTGERQEEMYLDEEALFNLPALLNSMAEGMLLTPPAMKRGFDWDGVQCHDDVDVDVSLWSD